MRLWDEDKNARAKGKSRQSGRAPPPPWISSTGGSKRSSRGGLARGDGPPAAGQWGLTPWKMLGGQMKTQEQQEDPP